jgi:hypothetical protein
LFLRDSGIYYYQNISTWENASAVPIFGHHCHSTIIKKTPQQDYPVVVWVLTAVLDCPPGTETSSGGTNTGLDRLPILMVGRAGYCSLPCLFKNLPYDEGNFLPCSSKYCATVYHLPAKTHTQSGVQNP